MWWRERDKSHARIIRIINYRRFLCVHSGEGVRGLKGKGVVWSVSVFVEDDKVNTSFDN